MWPPRLPAPAAPPGRPRPAGPIVIYDSGVGGLTVARHITALRPSADLLYVADNAWFPYGDKTAIALRARVYGMLHALVESARPAAIVVACNTASTAAAASLADIGREVPLRLVVPPVRDAVRAAGPGAPLALLATPATARNSLVRRAIAAHAAPGQIRLAPAMGLVHLAERKLAGEPVTAADARAALDPVLPAPQRAAVRGVLLGCTHFPWLLDELRPAFPAARHWTDPALQAARHVLAAVPQAPAAGPAPGARHLWLTTPAAPAPLRRAFARHGFTLTRPPAAA